MNAREHLKELISTLSEEQAQLIVQLIYNFQSSKFTEDKLDENGEVIVDEFYQQMIDEIEDDNEPSVSASKLYSELGIVR